MKFSTVRAVVGSAVLLVAPVASTHHHSRIHASRSEHPHLHHAKDISSTVSKRSGQCQFPTNDPNLVAVTPDAKNAGWAMSPDQECKPGNWCPFACKPGMVMAQWDPDSTYAYPSSMNGGLYCDKDGKISKPFSDKPNCVKGTGTVAAVNKCGKKMSWCQTVLPGNEAMLIPTLVDSSAVLAVPDPSYWQSTAAHYYVNPPGTGEEGCIWGDDKKPVGNWSPYVAGTNTDGSGDTFVKIGWNPIWEDSGLKGSLPDYGIKIECPDGGCNGLPCSIDPSKGSGSVMSSLSAKGAGGSSFCVVTVSKGSQAHIVTYSLSGSGDSDSGSGDKGESDPPKEEPKETTSVAEPTTSEAPTTSSTSSSSSSSSTSTSTSTSAEPTTTSIDETTTSSSSTPTPTSDAESTSSSSELTTTKAQTTLHPGVFHENATSSAFEPTQSSESDDPSGADNDAAPTTSDKDGSAGRRQGNAAVAGLVVAFIAAACFF